MYQLTSIRKLLQVTHIVTVHYFEYTKHYQFSGESHDFWELLYVDKGVVAVQADDVLHVLRQGQLICHCPNEWHTVKAEGDTAPNLIVIAFQAKGNALKALKSLVTNLDQPGRHFLQTILAEAEQAYLSDLGDPDLKALTRNKKAIPGSEQLLKNALESLLINLIRGCTENLPSQSIEPTQKISADQTYNNLLTYIDSHIHETITLNDLALYTLLSVPSIERLIHKKHQCGAIAFIRKRRVEKAKVLIREDHLNFSELALQLGFHSIHYFSRVFKLETGMTLTEYSKSLR